ncbi:hypothetical protein AK830_g10361 [Neonectria ditissima]|uniref:Cytochrome P450 monooxygenase n=1 Tax=Neonectria ditissima TaxID=78410 RepID=A0A0P7B788_9HYPO|nr:hypothetical protein AK830_g10361 [Neonectria ditissima]
MALLSQMLTHVVGRSLGAIQAIGTMPCIVALSLVLAAVAMLALSSENTGLKDVPLANPGESWSLLGKIKARRQFVKLSKEVLAKARDRYRHQPFRLLTDWGELLILPPRFADEIRNDTRLSFAEAAKQDNHADIPGFETIHLIGRTDQPVQVVARSSSQSTDVVIEPMSKEMTLALGLNFGTSTDWKEMRIKPAILDIIARVSSRIQLGEELCRNEDWLRITKTYTTTFFTATTNLRAFPWAIRFLAHWLHPDCQKLRLELKNARRIITPLVQRRRELRQAALSAGKPLPRFNDAIDWADQQAAEAGSSFDPVVFQLTLSLLSIHTTYDLLQQTMIELARNPQYIEPIRQEVVQVLLADGWKKTSLAKMKLLDSAIKEAQRLKPGSIDANQESATLVTMRRYVLEEMTLSNGLVLDKGTRINVDNNRLNDPTIYNDPEVYNPYRFVEMREQVGKEHIAHLVSTSSTHLGFGHGEHACPGRFFAANEIKVALCHILVKYDWKLVPGTDTIPDTRGMVSKSSPETNMLVRMRMNPELDLDVLGES